MGDGHGAYIKDQLSDNKSNWKICSWHKNQRLMQVGGLPDEVGWEPYEECRKGGAIVATAHDHSYARTHLMDNFEAQSVASTSSVLQVERGKSFAFVSGLAGKSVRHQNDDLADKEWWAATYTADQGAAYGALFCTFNRNGSGSRAHCYFKDINGVVPDEFDVQVPASAGGTGRARTESPTPPDFKVAFIGDQGLTTARRPLASLLALALALALALELALALALALALVAGLIVVASFWAIQRLATRRKH